MDGRKYMNLVKDVKLVPQFSYLDEPIMGRRKCLTEESFVRLYLEEQLTGAELAEIGVDNKVLWLSVKVHYPKYAEQIERVKFIHKSEGQGLRGREGYEKAGKSNTIILDRDTLASMVLTGMSEYSMAERLGAAPQTVHKNLRRYKMKIPCRKLQSMREKDMEILQRIEILSPGVVEASYDYQKNPHDFYKKLYLAFVEVLKILWFIKEISSRHGYFRDIGRIPKDHICWTQNRGEVTLSMALLKENIPHQRYYHYAKDIGRNFTADFYFPNSNLLVEVDGSIHGEESLKSSDAKKASVMRQLGYKLLRVTSAEVIRDTDRIVSEIKSLL